MNLKELLKEARITTLLELEEEKDDIRVEFDEIEDEFEETNDVDEYEGRKEETNTEYDAIVKQIKEQEIEIETNEMVIIKKSCEKITF